VQHGEHDLDRRALLLLVHRDRDAAAVVGDGDRVVRVDRHLDGGGVAGESLVDGVVDDLPDEVVQTALTGRADVHARTLANRLETLEDGDVLGVVAAPLSLAVIARQPNLLLTRERPRSGHGPGRSFR
jgi:hypothetical protein